MTRQFEVNDRYQPIVTIKKIKKDIPTAIEVSDRRYVNDNVDTYRGGVNGNEDDEIAILQMGKKANSVHRK